MKNLILVGIMLISINTFSQKGKKYTTVVIQTSAECAECEVRLESGLNYTKGIKFAELDMNSMKLTVKFKPKLIDLLTIKTKISSLGYTADDIPADQKALNELPACCKPGGMHSK
jgi:periplasmic mercuric ion binding protein